MQYQMEGGKDHADRKICRQGEASEKEPALLSQAGEAENQSQENEDKGDCSQLIYQLGRDMSINCLLHCSRSDYGAVALLNKSFNSLIKSGEIYRLRREIGRVEHWVYFSCNLPEWEAFDPNRGRWMYLPKMISNDCFMFSDKESLAVGTEVLVFGREITSLVIYRYCLLTNTWSYGTPMNTPRCLFGSASLGEMGILAGGCDPHGKILSSAERYSSETGQWEIIPSMNRARKMCSAVFMDGKFYVLGGMGVDNPDLLPCAEVYDPKKKTWTEIPNMYPPLKGASNTPAAGCAPPLLAVVKNELYAADYAEKVLRKYDKQRNEWITIGGLPPRAYSMNGWGLAFRACGDRLIVIGGHHTRSGGIIEINSWIPTEGPPEWELLASKRSGSFVYNCTVMGC